MDRVPSLETLRNLCRSAGQEHLLAHWDRLTEPQQMQLTSQIESIDFGQIAELASGHGFAGETAQIASRAEPPEAVPLGSDYRGFSLQDAVSEGNRLIAAGKVAMILVAGGQGTRLGFDQPKGMFPIGPVSGRTLFEMHVDSLKGAMKRFDVSIPMLIMTSPATDAATRKYFEENDRLGLRPDELILFQQGTMPAMDATTGRILLDSPFELALSPDGHGGIVSALVKSGVMETLRSRGIDTLFYAQVDNPLVRACDPVLIGYHRLAQSQMTTQVVRKRFAKERVGNVVQIDGRTHIIEYSDLPDSLAEQTLPDGSLKLWAGNIAVHVFDREFLEQAAHDAAALPFHRALKSVPFVDVEGTRHKPSSPNAIKMERFVFDLLPTAERTLVVEGDAAEVFAPVKNAEGSATDTPTTSRQAISKLHATWLRQAGWKVEEGVQVEIHPLWAWDADEVKNKMQGSGAVSADTYFT
jgi:UDP-N-acetylglucosamine/UDP-N-acetylgalactosamine diphosphorylase